MAGIRQGRLLEERALDAAMDKKMAAGRHGRSPSTARSPLGWLKARGLISQRQYEAGERLRTDLSAPNSRPK
jgi:hypothetical protein